MKLKLVPSTLSPPSFPLPSSSSSSVHRHKLDFTVTSKSKKHHRKNQGSNSPPRITSNPKQNLQFLKTWKEDQKRKSAIPRSCTSYRKKKSEKTDTPDDHGDLYSYPPSSLDHVEELGIINDIPPVMLVDGYNVCGYWLKLKEHFMSGQLELARDLLIHELKAYSRNRGVKVVVVFDAMMSGFPTHMVHSAGVDIVFSGKTTADTWIEREVSALKKEGCPTVWVVTSDHYMQQAAYGFGALIWSCKKLVNDIKESQKEADKMLQEQRPTFQGSMLKHNLDAKVVDALRNLRQQLSEKESNALRNLRQKLTEKEKESKTENIKLKF